MTDGEESRTQLGEMLNRAMPMEPVAALIVPEAELAVLTLAARAVVFSDADTDGEFRALIGDLDQASEPFADMLDLGIATGRRTGLRDAADHVRSWLDAGCITLPPIQHIRTLVEALR